MENVDATPSDPSIRNGERCQGRNSTSRKRPRQQQRQQQQQQKEHRDNECIIEVNPPQRAITRTRTFRDSSKAASSEASSSVDGDSVGLLEGDSIGSPLEASAGKEQQQLYDKSEAEAGLQQQQQQQRPCQVYRGENICPFCGYKCPDEEFPDGAVNHLRRFHSHQYHFTIEVLGPQEKSSLPTLCTTTMLPTESDASSSLSAANVPSNVTSCGHRSTIVVTAEPLMLRKKLGIDRRSDLRCQRTYYYIKSKIPIQTGHHQRDEQDEATNEWNQQLREKMICDIEDAGKGEQKFMSLWNKYWMSRPGKGERIVMTPAKVQAFIDQYASHLAPLEWELMAHLIALWEHKLLSSQHIEDCMIYNKDAATESDASSLSSANVPSNTMPRGNRSTIVVTAEPVMLRERLGIDRRSDLRCQRTYYYIKSKLPIQTGHHQRDEQGEAMNEWNQQLSEKMVCDIEDAGKGEQAFMSLWNKYWMSRPGKGERIVMTPAKVKAFIDQYASNLATLEWELMAHLIALWEHKLLSSKHIEDCMMYHQQVQKSQLKSSQQDGDESYTKEMAQKSLRE
eukprot:CAMPEP_0113488120 /NCGR_PEP_ID=MMETSP0014_2-20120614/25854_1 /TAXON_ID=2857 /ORGANISM="Nitzschia sp." /LENGTH=564 /DNA_ID=CAMNT_0000381825 /DNA_START=139 /DNA_END=1834 /DNA_ORIENTATION=+ /assembly_acc=CAM_ASM_000159